ncbi:MAG TPA: hypothetical protein VNH83_12635 [Bryobacteraceae bacterium]|nr:hypothetical protein [Bryobacteraceae bacterium]
METITIAVTGQPTVTVNPLPVANRCTVLCITEDLDEFQKHLPVFMWPSYVRNDIKRLIESANNA